MFWWGPESGYTEERGLVIEYGYCDDLYEGDDWTFYYDFDLQNSKLFIELIGTGNDSASIEEYIKEHFDSRSALEEFCEKNGIHGKCTHIGEYPPAHFGPYEF